jgi:hypothetical protein
MNNSVEQPRQPDEKGLLFQILTVRINLEGQNDAENANNNKANNTRPPYTINAVLHFLQHEINRFEMERAHWLLEQAELRVGEIDF